MKEISERANVSQATVSRVLSGSTAVSAAKKALVMKWVRKLEFEPNRSARALASRQSHLIGVILPDLVNPYFSEILSHIERIASRNGYSIILANTEGHPEREKDILRSLKSRQVDGLLVGLSSDESSILAELREQSIRSVIITQEHPGIDCVAVSHHRGGVLVAEHFLNIGIERFAFFGNPDDDKFHGYRDALLAAGVHRDRIEIIGNENWWLSMLDRGFRSAKEYLHNHRDSSRLGVFSINDPFALGVVHAGQQLGMEIPDELAVVGFDDTFICRNVSPTLSSVAQPMEEIGRLAVELLLKRIETPESAETGNHIVLNPRLIRRKTS